MHERCESLNAYIESQPKKAKANDPQNQVFGPFSPLQIRIVGHSPEQCGAGSHFDKAVNPEADKGNRLVPCGHIMAAATCKTAWRNSQLALSCRRSPRSRLGTELNQPPEMDIPVAR